MNSEPLILIENLSKAYPIYAKPIDMFWEIISGKPRQDTFWALRDISFSVRENERIGIIGPNGAGKTTLLKIITGNLQPTNGNVTINGKISAMLSLASSLNPEESGLSNIRFNLLVHGCPSSEIPRLTEEIIEFTELGAFIYAPVKTYSSGMNARLSFAITTSMEPEILVVDEVLSVGDGYFVGKARKRMNELCERGKALIFVSHAISEVQMLCDSVIWLENGMIRQMGHVDRIIKLYQEDCMKREDGIVRPRAIASHGNSPEQMRLFEIDETNRYRIRIVPGKKDQSFHDTHYIRKLQILGDGSNVVDIDITNIDINQPKIEGCIDSFFSEWGRLYNKDGCDCRILSMNSGKNKGGQILLNRPSINSDVWNIGLRFEEKSILKREKLTVEYANYLTGKWEEAHHIKTEKMENDWIAITADLSIPVVSDRQYKETIKALEQINTPDAEILDVCLVNSKGITTNNVMEQEPFEIRVHVRANRKIPLANVSIKIMSTEGIYVFWQSTGIANEDIYDLEGSIIVCFSFINNYLPGGDYFITPACGTGWDFKNFASARLLDYKISAFKFTVNREYPACDFGLINMRVPITYIKGK